MRRVRLARPHGNPTDGLVTSALRFPRSVVAAWAVVAVLLSVFVMPLEHVVQRGSAPFVPANAPSVRGLAIMDRAFGDGNTKSPAFVVLVDSAGLSSADDTTYRTIVTRLKTEPARVAEIEDYVDQPQLRSVFTSKDGKATYIPLGLTSDIGSAQSLADVKWLRALTNDTAKSPTTRAFVTGDPATITDLNNTVQGASKKITFVSVGLLVLILFVIYRRPVTILIPLVTIGVAVVVTRGLVAFLGLHGLEVSTFTPAFVAVIVLGAGTDYSVFLIARFQEELRNGLDTDAAVRVAAIRIGRVLAASAATVILGSALLAFAKLSVLAACGPAIALSIAVTAVVSLTLTPVLMRWAGTRISAKRQPSSAGLYSRLGTLVAARPARVLVLGLVLLGALATVFPTIKLSFNERAAQPSSTPSNQGYAALDAHFPANETLPDYLLIVSPHDMRNPGDLATLNTISQAVAKVPTVRAVYSLTQPTGTPLAPATLASQVGTIGEDLSAAGHQLDQSAPKIDKLSSGAQQLSDGATALSSGAQQTADAVDQFIASIEAGGETLNHAESETAQAKTAAGQLATTASQLAGSLQTAHDQTAQAADELTQIATALDVDPLCTVDPICAQSRKALSTIARAENAQLVPGLSEAAGGARAIAAGNAHVASGLAQLESGIQQAQAGGAQLVAGEKVFQTQLHGLSGGASQLAAGVQQLPPGVQQLLDQTSRLTQGLQQEGGYLNQINAQASSSDAGGFYLTASALQRPELSLARTLFLSPDGKIARLQLVGTTDPLTPSGQTRFKTATTTAEQALHKTPLAGATVVSAGAAGFGNDLNSYLDSDVRFVAVAVLLAVFLILVLTLRALIAPLYLLASVVLSYAAAMGLATLVWQHILGHPIEFFAPLLVFVMLVAVGADYNILLMSRLRESGAVPDRAAVSHAVSTTGAVITSAGIIFASTFAALVGSSLVSLAEIGFTIAAGLLLDTFVVRTLVVPSMAALLGKANWWPSRPAHSGNGRTANSINHRLRQGS